MKPNIPLILILLLPALCAAETPAPTAAPASAAQPAADQTPPTPAPECLCETRPAPAAAFELASAVFSGRVREIRPVKTKVPVRDVELSEVVFDVMQVWKGPRRNMLTLFRVRLPEDHCVFNFQQDEEYLVYADKTSLDVFRVRFVPTGREILDTTPCSGTKLLKDALNDRRVLGAGAIQ